WRRLTRFFAGDEIGEETRAIAVERVRADVRQLAVQVHPNLAAQLCPAATEGIILTEVDGRGGSDHAIEERIKIGIGRRRGAAVEVMKLRLRVSRHHALNDMTLDKKKACGSVNSRRKSIFDLELILRRKLRRIHQPRLVDRKALFNALKEFMPADVLH